MIRESAADRIAFPPFALYPRERRLTLHGKPIKIGARALDILVILAEQAGHLVSKGELMERVWPQQQIDESALRVHLSALRRVLGLAPGSAPSIVNETGRGYRFVVRHGEVTDSAPPMEPPSSAPAGASPLPRPPMKLVGRDKTVAMLSGEVARRRLVTLAGPGGVGKTVLALAVGQEMRQTIGKPAFFLDLATLHDSRFLASALEFALAGSADTGMSSVMKAECIRPSKGCKLPPDGSLLILDNCEHLLDASADLVERLLQAVPTLTVLATSREPLRASGEWIYRVPPLDGPLPGERLMLSNAAEFPAMALFIDRCGGMAGTSRLQDTDMPLMAEICRRLDGLPLAIEMAAAGLDSLSLRDIASRLDGEFQLLKRGRRMALPRQQTLRASIEWSDGLLSPAERQVLQRLSLFRGGFSLASAVDLAGDSQIGECAVVNAVSALVSKSMLMLDQSAESSGYRMLSTIRNYYIEQLHVSGDLDRVAALHLKACTGLLQILPNGQEANNSTANQASLIEDVRAAIAWGLGRSDQRAEVTELLSASAPLFFHLSLAVEYLHLVIRALDHEQDAADGTLLPEAPRQAPHADDAEKLLGHAIMLADFHGMGAVAARARKSLSDFGSARLRTSPLGFITFPGMQDVIRLDRIHSRKRGALS